MNRQPIEYKSIAPPIVLHQQIENPVHATAKPTVSPLRSLLDLWSGRQDLNLRPHGPKPRALPTAPHPDIAWEESSDLTSHFWRKIYVKQLHKKRLHLLYIKYIIYTFICQMFLRKN